MVVILSDLNLLFCDDDDASVYGFLCENIFCFCLIRFWILSFMSVL